MQYNSDIDGNLVGILYSSLPITYREKTIKGVFHHEIGTHYLRKYNESK